MNSHTTEQFRALLTVLSPSVQQRARDAYSLFKSNPFHPSLHFKLVHAKAKGPFYSVRIGLHYRALALREGTRLSGSGLDHMQTMIHYSLNCKLPISALIHFYLS